MFHKSKFVLVNIGLIFAALLIFTSRLADRGSPGGLRRWGDHHPHPVRPQLCAGRRQHHL